MSVTIDEVIKSNFKVYQDKFRVANEALNDPSSNGKNSKYSNPLIDDANKVITDVNFDEYSDFVAFIAFKELHLVHSRNKDGSSIAVNLNEEFINFKSAFKDNPDIISKYLVKAGPKFEVVPSEKVANLNVKSFTFFTELSFIGNKFMGDTLHKLDADDKLFFNSFGVGVNSENNYKNLRDNFKVFNSLSNSENVNLTTLEKVMEFYLKGNNLNDSHMFSAPKMIEVNIFAHSIDDNLEPFSINDSIKLMGPVKIQNNDRITDLTLQGFGGDYVKTYKFINALGSSKILKFPTLFNNMNQLLIISSIMGTEYKQRVLEKYSDVLSYDVEVIGSGDSNSTTIVPTNKILYDITIKAYEMLLNRLTDKVVFESDGNLIDATPGLGEIVADINDNFLIPEFSERLTLKVTKI